MKIAVKEKLKEYREDKKLSQHEMGELLNMSASTYGRLERGEVLPDLEQLVTIANKLEIPFSDFLPDSVIIHNNNQNGQVGIVVGNYTNNNYYYQNDTIEDLQKQVTELQEKLKSLHEKHNK